MKHQMTRRSERETVLVAEVRLRSLMNICHISTLDKTLYAPELELYLVRLNRKVEGYRTFGRARSPLDW